jgi:hypothetical protein
MTMCTGGGVAVAAVGSCRVKRAWPGRGRTVSATDGFPVLYRDKTACDWQQCLDFADPLCAIVWSTEPARPGLVPDNYPGEGMYARAAAIMPTSAGTSLVEMQLEQAFSSGEIAIDGDQITFARVRYFADTVPFGTVKVTSPTGSKTLVCRRPGSGQRHRGHRHRLAGVFSGPLGGGSDPS